VTNTRDKEEAKEVLQKIKDIINEAYRVYLKYGKPSSKEIEAGMKLDWMDIYNHLPKTNCGKCGFQTCSAFSISLLQGETQLAKCISLREGEFAQNLKKLKEKVGGLVLKSLGWE
jgi:ArsR family metal-binding transcriptional regulator